MQDNAAVLSKLNLYAKLSELHDENPFKYKSFITAAFNLKKIKEPFNDLDENSLSAVPGVGKSVLEAIRNILSTGSFKALDACVEKTPIGVVDLLHIKG